MAIASEPGPSSPSGSSANAVLSRLASSNDFSCEWPELRSALIEAINTIPDLFASPPRRSPSPSILVDESMSSENPPPPGSASSTASSPLAMVSGRTLPRSRNGRSSGPRDPDDLTPSTLGGLVIRPFPPLDPTKLKKAPTGRLGDRILGGGGKVNGSGSGPGAGMLAALGKPQNHFYEDEWDDDVVIGGKKLVGEMELEEGKRSISRLAALIEDMDSPPFTIQRIAELVLNPRKQHSNIGKFLRALEKNLLVTTPWEPQSYDPITSLPPITRSLENTMPPGSATPMFSPIPFLHPGGSGSVEAMMPNGHGNGNTNGNGNGRGGHDDGLMSPLSLDHGGNMRSPTPEPEDLDLDTEMLPSSAMSMSGDPTSPIAALTSGATTSSSSSSSLLPTTPSTALAGTIGTSAGDPGHQSFLGRVDELDTGPVTSVSSDGDPKQGGEGTNGAGAGEGGNMITHGMSDKPVPISSTTTTTLDSTRRIANMPNSSKPKGLEERFVSGGKEVDDVASEVERAVAGGDSSVEKEKEREGSEDEGKEEKLETEEKGEDQSEEIKIEDK